MEHTSCPKLEGVLNNFSFVEIDLLLCDEGRDDIKDDCLENAKVNVIDELLADFTFELVGELDQLLVLLGRFFITEVALD